MWYASLYDFLRVCHLPVGGMRIIKMFSWEKPFIRMVLDIRNREMTFIWKELAIYASFIAVLIVMPVIGKRAIVLKVCVKRKL